MAISKRVAERVASRLKQYVPVLEAQRSRDVSEADTVTVVKDILSDVFGYDKYAELTSEHAIRGTYCDLAIQFDGKVQLLIEVKSIGLALQERHVKQSVDYAANQGVEWVVLTNGIEWVLYHVLFKKPIEREEVVRLDLVKVDPKAEDDLKKLYLLTREGIRKDALDDYRTRRDATNRFTLAAILLNSEDVLTAVRREVRRLSDLLVDTSVIQSILREHVIKREALEGEQAADAAKRIQRVERKRDKSEPDASDVPATATGATGTASGPDS